MSAVNIDAGTRNIGTHAPREGFANPDHRVLSGFCTYTQWYREDGIRKYRTARERRVVVTGGAYRRAPGIECQSLDELNALRAALDIAASQWFIEEGRALHRAHNESRADV